MQNKSFVKNILTGIRLRAGKIFHNPYRKVNIGSVKKIYYKHLNAAGVRTHRLFGNELSFINPTELLHGLQEIFIEEVYMQKLRERPYIIDCGANIGLSVIYMKRLYPDAEIVAFEPDEVNFKLLEKNISSFGLDHVTLRKEAVWTENTILQFADEGSMSSRIDDGSGKKTIPVRAIRLKDFLTTSVDFLKIDIEGAEFQVMKDITDQLGFVNNLFLEYHGSFEQNEELSDLFSLLSKKGFSYYIKEATSVYENPFVNKKQDNLKYDVQLNIFCFRKEKTVV
jgi:FkbM family methyltransferase